MCIHVVRTCPREFETALTMGSIIAVVAVFEISIERMPVTPMNPIRMRASLSPTV